MVVEEDNFSTSHRLAEEFGKKTAGGENDWANFWATSPHPRVNFLSYSLTFDFVFFFSNCCYLLICSAGSTSGPVLKTLYITLKKEKKLIFFSCC
ncbi:hypothetical protein HanRHA438_Chr12g0548191 [Helianthus annuus]|nr:hypothetical protein HanRHA438_Chr12g0548191 [Helianthus annuus]